MKNERREILISAMQAFGIKPETAERIAGNKLAGIVVDIYCKATGVPIQEKSETRQPKIEALQSK